MRGGSFAAPAPARPPDRLRRDDVPGGVSILRRPEVQLLEIRLDLLAVADCNHEHALRRLVLKQSSRCALRRVIITVADRIADPDGLWPADFDLLTRAPGLQQLTVISTEPVLTAGYLERLHAALPELDEA